MYVRTLARKILYLQPSNAASQLQDSSSSFRSTYLNIRTFCHNSKFLIKKQRACALRSLRCFSPHVLPHLRKTPRSVLALSFGRFLRQASQTRTAFPLTRAYPIFRTILPQIQACSHVHAHHDRIEMRIIIIMHHICISTQVPDSWVPLAWQRHPLGCR